MTKWETKGQESRSKYPSSLARGLCLLCWGAVVWWLSGTAHARPAQPSGPTPPAATPGSSSSATAIDPCVAAVPTMQTKALPAAPTHNALLASLMARARSRETTAAEPNRVDLLAVDLWSSRISPPPDGADAQTSQTLQHLIRQVHSLTLNEKTPAPPAAAAKTTEEPAAATPIVVANVEPAKPAPTPAAAPAAAQTATALSTQAQKTLEDLKRNPGQMRDPLETAELLFLSGRPTAAVPFYEEALRRTSAGATASGTDRAWILFQLGNCLRETDVAKAQDAYAKLVAEYPDSPWTQVAQASGQFLAWYQSARLDQLMAPNSH